MKGIKTKPRTLVFLILITVIVWGGIFYYIIDFYKAYNDDSSEKVSYSLENPIPNEVRPATETNADVLYQNLERDPFVFYGRIESLPVIDKTPKTKPIIIVPPPPKISQYKIMGTIINGDSRLVILEGDNNETHFLRVGESYKEITIKSITLEKIELLENKILKEIPIRK